MIVLTPKVRAKTFVSVNHEGPTRNYLFEVYPGGFSIVVHYDGRKAKRAYTWVFSNRKPVEGYEPTNKVPKECVTCATLALQDVWK